MVKFSVVISAFNEETKLEKCLKSVTWADEIIVVDHSSTDNSLEVAKKYTKKVYIQKNDPKKIDLQKNFGIQKATGDWIFILDADEVITNELKEEIMQAISNKEIDGFWIPRKNIIFNKWIQYTGWYPDYQLRLFRKGLGKYEKEHYHEPITVKGSTAKLKEHIIHYNYENIAQFLSKNLEVYARNESEELARNGYEFNYKDAIRFPLKEFTSRYFARQGYKDGLHGLILSLLMAFDHFTIFLYLWEKSKFIEVAQEEMEKGFSEFSPTIKKEVDYWQYSKKIEGEKDNLKRVVLRIKRKLKS